MNAHTLEVLEFSRIAEIIAARCSCEEAQTHCVNKRPSACKETVMTAKALGSDMLRLLQTDAPPRIKNRPPLYPALKQLHTAGCSLGIEDLYAVGLTALHTEELSNWALQQDAADTPVCALIRGIPSLQRIQTAVFSFIDKNGELRDIPSLTALKKRARHIEADIEKTIRAFCTEEATRGMLQTPAPVLRNGRQVIAVRSNFKGRIKGIIHEYSQSGQSFYLEPDSIVIKNNELVRAQAEYEQELHRLLQHVSAAIAEECAALETAHRILLELDCAQAAALWAKEAGGVFVPNEGESRSLYLHGARHPLLGDHAVPIDVQLNDSERILIITGPNTGGKTVSLKTAALFVLLNQTGWPVLAGERTRLPFFRFVGCAIGDEQSLDRSLSTFSAYMRTVAELLSNADTESLIILDELGSGTDPQEGGALAMAILDELAASGAWVFVTSHHGVLKNYAYRKNGCVNASVAFDEHTLRPAYRIIMGIPGESHAIDIAEKNGIKSNIINAARSYIADNSADAAALIKGLMEKHEKLELAGRKQAEAEKALTEKQRRCDLTALKLRQHELTLRSQGYKRLNDLFEQKRNAIENLIRDIQENGLTHEKTAAFKQFFADFQQTLTDEHDQIITEERDIAAIRRQDNTETAHGELTEGLKVFIPHLRRRGIIIRKEKKKWLVAMDTLKMVFSADQIETLDMSLSAEQNPPRVLVETELQNTGNPQVELRIIGMRLDEAEKSLQTQLDLAVMHNMREFSVVHGKGNGILQTMVQEKLANAPYVADFFFARPEDGGSGKTIVHLR